MILFSLSLLCLGMAARELGAFRWVRVFWRSSGEKASLQRIVNLLQEIEETLEAGLVPAPEAWEELRGLPAPWAELGYESLMGLRAAGGSLLPTLRRLRGLAEAQVAALLEAKARAAQALAQAWVSALLVPIFGTVLYLLLPGLKERALTWFGMCGAGVLLSSIGGAWMLRMAEEARWGGLAGPARSWGLAAQCGGERLLALVRSGTPPDLAWNQMIRLLDREAPGLSIFWGHSVFQARGSREGPAVPAARAIAEAGDTMRKAIHVSLLEGRPCTERVEGLLESLRQELKSWVERELSLLGTRALKPLFLCVAPALLGLLGGAVWLSWSGLHEL